VLAKHVDHALISPESLQHFDTIIVLSANGTIIIAADASFTPERCAEAAEPAIQADEAEFDTQNDSAADIISLEARRLNDGRDTMEDRSRRKSCEESCNQRKSW
jgi:hypothetical protein